VGEVLRAGSKLDQEERVGRRALRVVIRKSQGVAALVALGHGTIAKVVLLIALARPITILVDKRGRKADRQRAAMVAQEVVQARAAGPTIKVRKMASKAALVTRDPAVRSEARQPQISGAHFREPTGIRIWAVAVTPATRGVAAVVAAAAALARTWTATSIGMM
jgi:glycerol-3-phosphate O-acyltransferase